MKTQNPMDAWPDYIKALKKRMVNGEATYGNKSFLKTPTMLSQEIKDEIMDICCWSYILLVRLSNIDEEILKAEERLDNVKYKTKLALNQLSKSKSMVKDEKKKQHEWRNKNIHKMQGDQPLL
jgi:hypothetical protein